GGGGTAAGTAVANDRDRGTIGGAERDPPAALAPEPVRRNDDGDDLVVVAHAHRETVPHRIEGGGQPAEDRAQHERVATRLTTEAHPGAHPPNGFGPVPDRRRPGPLLHGRVEEGIGRGTEATIREGGGRRGRLCGAVDRERIDPVLLAHARAPAADRVLERA